MRRGGSIAAALAGLALAAAPLGLADSSSFSDPRGDLDPTGPDRPSDRYDLVRATQGHTRSGRIVHTVTVAGDIANPASEEVPFLWIDVPERPNGTQDCRYFVGRHDGRLGVFTCGYGERVGSARIRRTGAHTVRYEFSPRAIDDPASYDWAFVAFASVSGTRAWIDRLPNGGGGHGLLHHDLR